MPNQNLVNLPSNIRTSRQLWNLIVTDTYFTGNVAEKLQIYQILTLNYVNVNKLNKVWRNLNRSNKRKRFKTFLQIQRKLTLSRSFSFFSFLTNSPLEKQNIFSKIYLPKCPKPIFFAKTMLIRPSMFLNLREYSRQMKRGKGLRRKIIAFWSLLILLLSVVSIRRKLLNLFCIHFT